MMLYLVRWTMLGLIGITVTTPGCTRWIDVIPSPAGQPESAAQSQRPRSE